MRLTLKIASLFFLGLLVVACEQDGPAEQAGEALDDAAGELRDGGEKLANMAEDACEDLKEGVNAKNSNC